MPRGTLTIAYVNQFLSPNGDGTGDIEMTGDYSSAEGIFYIEAPSGYHLHLNRLLVFVQDTGAFDAGKYGNNLTLTSGIMLEIVDDSDVVQNTITPRPIFHNGDWGGYCFDIENHDFGVGDEILLVRWTFGYASPPGFPPEFHAGSHMEGWPFLEIPSGWKFRVRLNDNLSGLVKHRMSVQGVSLNVPHVHG